MHINNLKLRQDSDNILIKTNMESKLHLIYDSNYKLILNVISFYIYIKS